MKVLVIGSTGFMGGHLVSGLIAAGIDVRAASSSDGTGIDAATGLLPADYQIPNNTSAVIYLAQSPRYREKDQAAHVLAVNVFSAVRAANAARSAGVLRFIYVSTGTVYAPSFLPLAEGAPTQRADWYSLSKIQGEEALGMFRDDMDVHVVRPFGVYGPNQRGRLVANLLDSINNFRPISVQRHRDNPADIDGLRISLCHIDDATSILVHLITQGGPPLLNLAGDQSPSIRELAMKLGGLLDKTPEITLSASCRNFDLIADVGLLRQSYPGSFTPLDQGLASLISA